MREAWRELMFADCDQAAKLTRDPVAPAKRSDAAMKKVLSHTLDDGTPTHSFQTLTRELETVVRNTCRTPQSAGDAPTFQVTTTPSEKQKRTRIDRSDQNVDRTRNLNYRAFQRGNSLFSGKNFRLTQTSYDQCLEAVSNFLYFQPVDIAMLYALRRVVEPELAANVATRLTEVDLAELEALIGHSHPAHGGSEDWNERREADLLFHDRLADACSSPCWRWSAACSTMSSAA
ncbi:FCD domain-containing protein [Polaromonas sp. P2-4]|nr:FCD domain-containing protein [Polaromonas sp. P2-4]